VSGSCRVAPPGLVDSPWSFRRIPLLCHKIIINVLARLSITIIL
jgi:hypothetical protein